MRFNKTRFVIVFACVFVTSLNGVLLSLQLGGLGKKAETSKSITSSKLSVKQSKKVEISESTQRGNLLGNGKYKSTELDKSKIESNNSAELVVATHNKTGGHYVIAFLADSKQQAVNNLADGWQLKTVANDPMWAPGACASKPTILLDARYIFIDDGKTNPDDKYSSYVLFDIQTGKYRYFGGSDYTPLQAEKEKVLYTAYENDKLVFYIDPIEDNAAVSGGGNNLHNTGKDKGYIIRREISLSDLSYKDYSLPFNAPKEVASYSLSAYSDKKGVLVSLYDASNYLIGFNGAIADNKIAFERNPAVDYSQSNGAVYDSAVELELKDTLESKLADLVPQEAFAENHYVTAFGVTDLGTAQGLRFTNVTQRFGQKKDGVSEYNTRYGTPVILDIDNKTAYPMVNGKSLVSGTSVNLGVF